MDLIKSNTDKSRALDILEQSFASTPGINWIIGKYRSKRTLRTFLSIFYHDASARNGAYLTKDRNGVVLFYQLQNRRKTLINSLRKIYVVLFLTGIKNGIKAIKYQRIVNNIRPEEGWIGLLSATDSAKTNSSAANEIKQEMFHLADSTNQPIYLETTIPRVMLLSKAAGYIEYNQIKHPYKDLTIWFLQRDPQKIN